MRHTSNCIVFAVRLYVRRRRKGKPGYLLVRRSHWGRFPHMLYAEMRRGRLRVVSFVPLEPRHKALPPPCFGGRVRWGDA